MTNTIKAVASFSETGWRPIEKVTRFRDPSDEHNVLDAWAEAVGDLGIGFDDIATGVEWQKVDGDTMAYRICGKLLLVVAWSYDAELCGEDWHSTLTIDSWTMGTESEQ
jgi:hypothetical protein